MISSITYTYIFPLHKHVIYHCSRILCNIVPPLNGMFVAIPFTLDVRLVDAPAGVTEEEGPTGFLHLAFAVLC